MLAGLVLLVWGCPAARRRPRPGAARRRDGARLARRARHRAARALLGLASHALLLAALPAVAAAGVLFFAGAPWVAIPLAAVAVLAAAHRACGAPSGGAARLGRDGDRREAHAAARAAPRDRDLPRRGADDRVLPRPDGARRRPRRAVRRRPRVAPRVVRGAGRASGHARLVHAVPRAADRRGRRRLDAPLRLRGRSERSRRPGATTCAARASSARTSSTAAPSARSTSAIPTGTSSRSRPAGPASPPAVRPCRRADRRRSPALRGPRPCAPQPAPASANASIPSASSPVSRAASARRWRSVIEPTVFVSDIGIEARNRRQRVRPQRCWLSSRSAIAMLSASHGHSSTISATVVSPSATCRLSSARARRTRFA